jgi:RNA polymerase sigma factor (sigma-70 family)
MAGGPSFALLRDMQTLFDGGTVAGLPDRQLLERYSHDRDASADAAFEVLVRRHGPMVLRVCRNVLKDWNDAEDAFQATFIVLARRCGSIHKRDSVESWLFGVACRVAARARVAAARRRAVERRGASEADSALGIPEDDDADRLELGPIVQEEVRRLPEKYRAAVVLCYWEGLTQEQAAAQLGCPLGTVRSRLARARDLLRRRLSRRGFEPMAFGFDAIRRLPPLAPELVRSTVRAAAGQMANPVVSAAAASLVQRMLWRTTMIKLGVVAAGVIAVGLTGYGVGVGAQQSSSDLPAVQTKSPSKPEMPAIAEGTSREAQEQIEALGLKNIIVRSVKPSDEAIASSGRPTQILNYGLKYSDYDRMVETIPTIRKILPIRELKKQIRRGPNVIEGRVVGTTHEYGDFNRLQVEKGRFLMASDNEKYQNYAVLAAETAERLFPNEDPLNQSVKLGSDYYTVVGITARRATSAGIGGSLAAQDFNKDVYIPLNTCRLRFGERIMDNRSGSRQAEETQLTQITLQVNSIDDVLPTVPLVRASYEKYHPKKDVEMVVPYDLLLSARLHGRARRSDVRWINSGVQGQATLLTIVPDGSVVKKGDVLVALDSSALSNQLINQRITTKSAEAIFLNTKLARENADHALTAYQDDLFPRDEREAKGEVDVAERELAVAQGQLESGDASGLGRKRAELDLARAKLALEKARNRLHILTQYTKHQQTLGLEMAVKKARSDELSKGATWELEKGKEQQLERMIAACTIVAPTDGTVVYSGRLEPGATIRERDSLMRIVPPPDADPDRR